VWDLLLCAKHLLIAAKYRLAALNCAPRCNNHPHLGGVVFGDRLNLFALNARPTT
jgi:hypothetical protein